MSKYISAEYNRKKYAYQIILHCATQTYKKKKNKTENYSSTISVLYLSYMSYGTEDQATNSYREVQKGVSNACAISHICYNTTVSYWKLLVTASC
jgi:hypothetical protein